MSCRNISSCLLRKPLIMALSQKIGGFPKIHIFLQHAFDDIEAKGVTATFSTKPNEQMHGPIRKFYQSQTNFKNVEPQVCTLAEIF